MHGARYCYPINKSISTSVPGSDMHLVSSHASVSSVRVPVQQGLADLDPDVVGGL